MARAATKTRRSDPVTGDLVVAEFLRGLLGVAEESGVDAAQVCAELGVSPRRLEGSGASVPVRMMADAWRLLPRLSGDPCFGLHSAERLPPGAYGRLEHATLSSPTVREALARAVRYQRVTYPLTDVAFRVDDRHATLTSRSFGLGTDDELKHYTEHGFAFVVTRVSWLAPGLMPQRVAFAHAAPADVSEHRRVFGVPIAFAQPRAEVVYDARDVEQPLATSNPAFLREFAAEDRAITAAAARAAASVRERARLIITAALQHREPSVQTVAKALALSPRSLQRKLTEEGSTFSGLLDEARGTLARRWVLDARLPYGEMAYRLGFSQLSVFFRAFKRWTGKTPSEFRGSGRR